MGAIKAIECDEPSCKKLMRHGSPQYICVRGNLSIGETEVISGNVSGTRTPQRRRAACATS